jgi:RNA polymerase sigma factor (sigma-70 family)
VLYLKGEKQAFAELEHRYHDWLLNYFRKHNVKDEDDRNDLLQQTFYVTMQIMLHGRYDFSRVFAAFIFRIAQLVVKKHFDTRNPRRLLKHGWDENTDTQSCEQPATKEKRKWLDAALRVLSPHEREVFLMHFADGMSEEKIAERFHCSASTIRNTILHARKKMIKFLAKRGIGKGDI